MIWALASLATYAADPELPPTVGEHARQAAAHPDRVVTPVRRAELPPVTAGPDAIVYGYQAYWADDLQAVPWDDLSHLALFSVGSKSDGTLGSTSNWDDAELAVSMADAYGVRVHLCITNFDTSSLRTFLGSSAARSKLIATLGEWKRNTGAHGINVDFEGLPSDRKTEFVEFIRDLQAEVGEVVIATPAVDWSGAFDYSELSKYADLFIMGYGYHYSGSSTPGPNDPLHGGGAWNKYALDWTIDDYIASDADPKRVILGLPLYGNRWSASSESVGASATSDGSAVFWAACQDALSSYGTRWDESSKTPWWWDGSRQGWCGNADSLRQRIQYAVDREIGGIGFWALHYDNDDADLWAMIHDETTWSSESSGTDTGTPPDTDLPDETGGSDDPAPSGNFTANAGRPFLAYVGDTVILSGANSRGPDGVDLEFRWTQVGGPTATLADASTDKPSFVVEEAGTTVFELLVGDGASWSAPARSYVIVIDKAAGTRHADAGCGCDSTGWSAAPVLAAALLLRRRRT
jgi:uncharacterized protein (TIGR03382 family)